MKRNHSCSTNINLKTDSGGECDEKHIGNTPRSIMTKGNSVANGTRYGNFIKGNRDKLMMAYRREPTHDYMMAGACDVFYKGEIHFFGGQKWYNLTRQHFVIETDRGKSNLPKMRKEKNLAIEFEYPKCMEMTREIFGSWISKTFVILCFGNFEKNSCYSFDDKENQLTLMGYSNVGHYRGGLQTYQRHLLTVGNEDGRLGNKKTELNKNGDFNWTFVDPEFTFKTSEKSIGISRHSMMTIKSSDINEEYIILIGGVEYTKSVGRNEWGWNSPVSETNVLKNVFKFNGTWFSFGKLNKPRWNHSSIYWNGAVYVIGGQQLREQDWDYSESNQTGTKMEIWKIKDSPYEFQTTLNWPELFNWKTPYLFIVSDSFFPDH